MPTAASPRSTMRCSATAESTPPDMATAVRRRAARTAARRSRRRCASARASSATAAHSLRARPGSRARRVQSREAERRGVEQRSALGACRAPGRRGARARRSRARRSVPRRSRPSRVEPRAGCGRDRHTRSRPPRRRRRVVEGARASEICQARASCAHGRARGPQQRHERGDGRCEPRAVAGRVGSPNVLRSAPSASDRAHAHGRERAARLDARRCAQAAPAAAANPCSSSSAHERVAAQAGNQREAVSRQARDAAGRDLDLGQRGTQPRLERIADRRGRAGELASPRRAGRAPQPCRRPARRSRCPAADRAPVRRRAARARASRRPVRRALRHPSGPCSL